MCVCVCVCVCVCEQQLDYDSRVVQRRLYQEALQEITLPALTRRMDSKWKTVGQTQSVPPCAHVYTPSLQCDTMTV